MNTTSDILKLLYVISRACGEWNLRQFWNITSGIYAKYHQQIMLLFVYTTTRKSFVIFTCRYFKLSWNTTALNQSNYRNFSCSSIIQEILSARPLMFTPIERSRWLPHVKIISAHSPVNTSSCSLDEYIYYTQKTLSVLLISKKKKEWRPPF